MAPERSVIVSLRALAKNFGSVRAVDGVDLDSCVLIRYLGADQVYHSGGGITFQSDMAYEYQEMIQGCRSRLLYTWFSSYHIALESGGDERRRWRSHLRE